MKDRKDMTVASELAADAWWVSPFRMLQTNLREQDASLDTADAVAAVTSLGYDTWLCNAGGIVYFYPVSQEYQRAATALSERESGDLVGDALSAARAADVRFLARFDFSRLPSEMVAARPEWAFIDHEDQWYIEDGLTAICPTSDYHEHLVPEILRDFVRRYAVDGIFFNWLQYPEFSYSMKYKGVCQCVRCQALFRAAHPAELHPRTMADPGYPLWLQIAREQLSALAARYARVVNEILPGTPVMLADVRVDVAFLETNSWLTGHGGGTWWKHTPSELASVNRIAHPDTPALVHSSVNVGLPFRQIAEQPSQFRRYIAQALSRGAQPSTVVIGQANSTRFPCLAAAIDLLQFYGTHRGLYAGYRSAAEVAIFRPGGGPVLGSVQTGDVAEYRGLYVALQESQIPFDVLGLQFQDTLTARALSQYRVILVPGTDGMDDALLTTLDAYVAGGGSVLLTGESFDLAGAARLQSAPAIGQTDRLEEVAQLGGRYVGPADGEDVGPLLPVIGRFSVARWREGSIPSGLVLSSQTPFGPPEISGGNKPDSAAHALVRAAFGTGRITQFPWTAGRSAFESGLTALDQLLRQEVRDLVGGSLALSGAFPADVELTVGRSGTSWIIHLVNHSGGRADRVRDPVPLRGELHLSGSLAAAVTTARAEVADHPLQIVRAVDGSAFVHIDLPTVLEVVRLD